METNIVGYHATNKKILLTNGNLYSWLLCYKQENFTHEWKPI